MVRLFLLPYIPTNIKQFSNQCGEIVRHEYFIFISATEHEHRLLLLSDPYQDIDPNQPRCLTTGSLIVVASDRNGHRDSTLPCNYWTLMPRAATLNSDLLSPQSKVWQNLN